MRWVSSTSKAWVAACATLAIAGALAGCQQHQDHPEKAAKPNSAQIETMGMKARQQDDASAQRQLTAWSARNVPVAQRELALVYKGQPARRAAALQLFEQAARAGDTEAAFELGEMLRLGVVGVAPAPAAAAPWYRIAAANSHAKAALILGMLYKNGDGVARDDAQAAHWLDVSSELGNPHAMFLLSYIVKEGRGVAPDPARARHLLEEAAEHEYPPAIQELAMVMQLGDGLSRQDTRRAGELMKEATEHRHNNWNRF